MMTLIVRENIHHVNTLLAYDHLNDHAWYGGPAIQLIYSSKSFVPAAWKGREEYMSWYEGPTVRDVPCEPIGELVVRYWLQTTPAMLVL